MYGESLSTVYFANEGYFRKWNEAINIKKELWTTETVSVMLASAFKVQLTNHVVKHACTHKHTNTQTHQKYKRTSAQTRKRTNTRKHAKMLLLLLLFLTN